MSKTNNRRRSRPEGTSELEGLVAQPEPVLVGDQVHAAANSQSPEVQDFGTSEVPESGTPGAPESGSAEVPHSETAEVRESESSEVPKDRTTGAPKFATLERKDVRLRDDQVEQLRSLAKRLSRARTDRSERITENTLVRVAVDMLFARGDALRGDTEEQLRKSATSGVRKYRSSQGR